MSAANVSMSRSLSASSSMTSPSPAPSMIIAASSSGGSVAALASALACDGETTGWRCSDGNACAHQPHALRRVMLHWKPAAGATGTDAAEDDFFGDDEPPGGPSETITL